MSCMFGVMKRNSELENSCAMHVWGDEEKQRPGVLLCRACLG